MQNPGSNTRTKGGGTKGSPANIYSMVDDISLILILIEITGGHVSGLGIKRRSDTISVRQ